MSYVLPNHVHLDRALTILKASPFFDEEYALTIPRYRLLTEFYEISEENRLDIFGIEILLKTLKFFPKFFKYYPIITIYDNLDLVVLLINKFFPKTEVFWSPYIEAPFILRLLSKGFIPIATKLSFDDSKLDYIVLLPKFHIERLCIIPPKSIHIPKKSIKWARDLHLTLDTAFERVIAKIVEYHGENWLYPSVRTELLRLFYHQRGIEVFDNIDVCVPDNSEYNDLNASIHSIEIWRGESLVAGEIGCNEC